VLARNVWIGEHPAGGSGYELDKLRIILSGPVNLAFRKRGEVGKASFTHPNLRLGGADARPSPIIDGLAPIVV
jgi:hypothetical protein